MCVEEPKIVITSKNFVYKSTVLTIWFMYDILLLKTRLSKFSIFKLTIIVQIAILPFMLHKYMNHVYQAEYKIDKLWSWCSFVNIVEVSFG